MDDDYTDVIGGDYLSVLALVEAELNNGPVRSMAAWDTLSDITRMPRDDDNWRMLGVAVGIIVGLVRDITGREGSTPGEWVEQFRRDVIEVAG